MRVLIVGGGSAGWIAASRLDSALNRANKQTVEIAVLESPDIGRIGVGEATIPSIHRTLRGVNMDEAKLLTSCAASYKMGIRFDDWSTVGASYWHPFFRLQSDDVQAAARAWLNSDGSVPFADLVSPQPKLAEAGRAPPRPDDTTNSQRHYAYHLDAELFADTLRDLAVARGVKHIQDTVVAIERDPHGIHAVRTASGCLEHADLFVDCTGFRRLLIGACGAKHNDWSDWLLCDRAATMRVPDPSEPSPYTVARAADAGWMWDIGLQGRRGRGHVYSSAFVSEAQAEASLRRTELTGEDAQVRHLQFSVGRLEAQWIGNCVAIGLSGGFVEPLESTGLHLADFATEMLIEYFPHGGMNPALARRFNQIVGHAFDETLDFVNLHYVLSRRRDTEFWRAATASERIAPGVRDLLERWEGKPPTVFDFTSATQLWSHQNYEFILFGMGWRPNALGEKPNTQISPPREVEMAVRAGLKTLPLHAEALKHASLE